MLERDSEVEQPIAEGRWEGVNHSSALLCDQNFHRGKEFDRLFDPHQGLRELTVQDWDNPRPVDAWRLQPYSRKQHQA